jgi:hypothetical protein
MKYIILEKAKRIWVPPSGRKKGYWREDPREKKEGILGLLKDLLDKIRGLKKQGKFTPEQRKYVQKRLKEIEPRIEHFKTQKQRMAVFKALKEIRTELEEKTTPKIRSKNGTVVSDDLRAGLKSLGYSVGDMGKMSIHEIKAIYHNEIPK